MPLRIAFSKYQGLGNDFLVLDGREVPISLTAAAVRRICDRNRGVGADGILLVEAPSRDDAHIRMRVHNADGSIAETCGNGLRCVMRWLLDRGEVSGAAAVGLELGNGALAEAAVEAGEIRVSMGAPSLEASDVPTAAPLPVSGRILDAELVVEGERVRVCALALQNPHAVLFDPPAGLARLGPLLERHPVFPRGANVGLARVASDGGVDLEVWERGAGPTLACGSGACAAVVAGVATGRLPSGRPVEVRLPGGPLRIEVAPDLSGVWMTGGAEAVFEGVFDLDRFRVEESG